MSVDCGRKHKLLRLLEERNNVLILDGGLATALESESVQTFFFR